jgi:uncharacterized membrane protein
MDRHDPDQHRPRAIAVARESTSPGHALLLAAAAAIAVLLFSLLRPAHAGLFGGPDEVRATGGVVAIPVAQVSDGKAHFYSFKTGGKDVKFFAIKSRDGVIRTALDACDVCYQAKKGYAQQGDSLVCNNCGQKFHSARVMEVKGGCNPSPLPRAIEGGKVVIRAADLAAGAKFF